jgi:excisionase family DNA binding protein
MVTDEWMTIQQAAAHLKLTVQTIRNNIKSGKLKSYRNGKIIRLKRIDVDSFLK